MMGSRRFGDAGDRVVVEERLLGEEASYYAICDGERIVTLAAAQDHKRALDGDQHVLHVSGLDPRSSVNTNTARRQCRYAWCE